MQLDSTNRTLDWDGAGTLRVRYDGTPDGLGKLTNSLRTRLGERVVPVEALQAVELSPDAPVLRLLLREDADPLLSVSGGSFDALLDPYSFPFTDRALAQRIADGIRVTLVRRDVPTTPAVRWLVAPPAADDRIEGRDATVSVANGRLEFAYARTARRKKKSDGDPWSVPLGDITDVEWRPNERRLGDPGFLRISTARTPLDRPKPRHDPAAMITDRRTDVDALFFAARLLTRIRP